MKKMSFSILSLLLSSQTFSAVKYDLTVYNGSGMPLSASAVYVRSGSGTDRTIGARPTDAFIGVCEKGNASARVTELRKDPRNSFVAQLPGPIMPGEMRTIKVTVDHPYAQELHFETMYAKTKETCGVIDVPSRQLTDAYHSNRSVQGRDMVVVSGAYENPKLGTDPSAVCAGKDAVTCLRLLSAPVRGEKQVRAFRPYLPSVLDFLEDQYGADEVDTLLIPTSGAIAFQLKKTY